MKTKTLVLLVALFLSLTLLPVKMLAQGASLPTEPKYFNPADPGDVPNPKGFNLNFIGALMLPQAADTFIPLENSLDGDVRNNPVVDHNNIIVLTQKDAVEGSAGENTITIPQDYGIRINLEKTLVKATFFQGEHRWDNPWSFQQDNNNLHAFLLGGIFSFQQGDDKNIFSCEGGGKPGWMEIPKKLNDSQKINITYFFKACSLGQTTLTFNYENEPVPPHQPKTVTFRFNVVEAPAASATDESSANNTTR